MDKKKNEGISCCVTDCIYHEGTSTCTASKIAVGPCSACSSGETACETFVRSNR